jgi:methylisocitrate lyase
MLHQTKTPTNKRADFAKALKSGKLLQFPGAFSPLVSMLIEEQGFEGVYISGAVLANDLGLPDIGLTTLTEVSQRARAIARVTNLPAIVDIDTGFGEPLNAMRTVQELEEFGLSGCHLEDQVNPKRCGHLDNKQLVDRDVMTKKIKAAVDARRDKNFLIIARTDSRASEGLDKAIDRAKAYIDAGAQMIFPEALKDESEFEKFRKEITVPLLANMTEFGKSKLLTKSQLEALGFNLVIYPVTGLRIAMGAVESGFAAIKSTGTQESWVNKMQTRKRLYEILKYPDYNQFDQEIFNFKV